MIPAQDQNHNCGDDKYIHQYSLWLINIISVVMMNISINNPCAGSIS